MLGVSPVSVHDVDEFNTNVQLLARQMGSKLLPYVTTGQYSSKGAVPVEQVGDVDMVEQGARNADTNWTEILHDRPWVFPKHYDAHPILDRRDDLKQAIALKGPYTQAMVAAANLRKDKTILENFFVTRKVGPTGAVDRAFPVALIGAGGNKVGVQEGAAANTGLTVAKLRAALKTMRKRHIDLEREKPIIAVGAEQIDDLLAEPEVISGDYNGLRPLQNGEIVQFLGFTFVPSEYLPGVVDGVRQIPVWVKSGMHLGMWHDIDVHIDVLPTKNHSIGFSIYLDLGATRIEENKVLMIECDEAA